VQLSAGPSERYALVERFGLCCMKGATAVPAHSPWLGPLFDQGRGARGPFIGEPRLACASISNASAHMEEGLAMDIQTKHEFWIIAVSTVAMVVACAIAFAVFAQLLDF
jgi:hypothetical protein